jgi:lysyl-tRNA synthetase class 2
VSGPVDYFEESRREKLRHVEQLGLDPWGGRFDGHQPVRDILALDAGRPEGARPRVRAAGRVVAKRGQGKLFFLDLWDWTTPPRDGGRGKLQVMVGQKQVPDTSWKLVENIDLGDLVGVDGTFGRTKVGEPTLFAQELHFLGKSLLPHPDKWGGMQDVEFRLRHRYLDLVYTPEVLERALQRVQIVRRIRRHLDGQGFVEVETPTLQAVAAGAAARPFVTHHNALAIDLYLRIALELPLKRLLVGGVEKVYEIGRVFRNEGIDARHNPEFTMLELYQAYSDYEGMMELTEGLVVACVRELGEGTRLPYGERTIDYTPPWERRAYPALFQEHVGASMFDGAAVEAAARRRGLEVAGKDRDVLVHELFEKEVEAYLATLDRPVFVHDYPAALCPLTKRRRDNPEIAERFELYVLGMEVANAYTELNDPQTQEATFRRQLAGLPEEQSMARMDEDFVRALRHGMPPAGGLGIGIDRMVMLLTNAPTIRDVILFPLLRPEAGNPKSEIRNPK